MGSKQKIFDRIGPLILELSDEVSPTDLIEVLMFMVALIEIKGSVRGHSYEKMLKVYRSRVKKGIDKVRFWN